MYVHLYISSVAQSCLTLRPHGLQHARLPCSSPTPGAYVNSCPSSQWCHATFSSSVVPFSHLQSSILLLASIILQLPQSSIYFFTSLWAIIPGTLSFLYYTSGNHCICCINFQAIQRLITYLLHWVSQSLWAAKASGRKPSAHGVSRQEYWIL